MSRILFVLLTCLLKLSVQRSYPEDDSYVAAVLEFQVSISSTLALRDYVDFIKVAADKNADIVVFPELTLTRGGYSTIPIKGLLLDYPVPALNPEFYDEFLIEISNAARVNSIYVVINVQERVDCTVPTEEVCPEEKIYFFNTDVVFDRNGAVIDRYRKINLFGEPGRTPALSPELGIFETDFGVKFGHHICFDLMFQVPSIQIIEKHNITDVIFPTMWFSEMPYLTAVQIQQAYASSMNINFLASGANNVRIGSAGSGIFSGKAGALTSIMPGVPTTELLIAKVPKIPGQVTEPISGPIYNSPAEQDSLRLIVDPSYPAHITRELTEGFQEFILTDKQVSCQFSVKLNQRPGTQNYKYRAAAFDGVRSFTGVATGGNRVCSVVACTGDTIDTCGTRFPVFAENTTAIFEELTIVATVPTPVIDQEVQARDSAFFPLSLDIYIMPLKPQEFTYYENEYGNVTIYNLTLNNYDAQLYSFAVWGRVFATDGDIETPPVEVPRTDSYVAAVLEYTVPSSSAVALPDYVNYIKEAADQKADIMVFPEMTLTRGSEAVNVPIHDILLEYPIPALHPELYDDIIVSISNASRSNRIYVVINVQERMDCTVTTNEECPEDIVYLFNTNVVFDRNGAVIDRYRKINLFGERNRTPALTPDLGVFETDFGVTFGHHVCFDLMFQVPALQVVEKYNLTDVIFTTMWFSEMPYLTAVQIQEGFAYSMNINFIASGANNVGIGSAGSGIFSGKAGALVSTMPGTATTQLLVARVPKVPGNVTEPPLGPIYDDPVNHDGLVLITDPSYPAHITKELTPGSHNFTLKNNEVSCRFTVTIARRAGDRHYKYRAAAFDGIRSFTGVATGGNRVCSVVACTGDTKDTCGQRFPQYAENTTAIFEELIITATVPTPVFDPEVQARNSAFFPVSMEVSIMPLEVKDFTFTENIQSNRTVYTFTLKNKHARLYTFAIWGRVFATDGKEESPPAPDSSSIHFLNYLILPILFLIQFYSHYVIISLDHSQFMINI
ncbi:vanin-like protein 1 [Achroia grisella]|uniref:vanin-like protein 1 n=1 Tax=Achroia grisella TaxID=688607 RepID=UPI0027D2D989|nr:vanin-like protein 1 [Achroia grisella]